jgi:nitric oxide reductase activation protein
MTTNGPEQVRHFGLLATYVAGRAVEVAPASAGQPAYTNGRVIFAACDRSADEQRRQVVLQGALLAAGSLAPHLIRSLRLRPELTRRYLAIEGRRALAELAERLPLAAGLCPEGSLGVGGATESLAIAKSRRTVPDPPEWFGVVRPSLLLAPERGASSPAGNDLGLHLDPTLTAEPDDENEDQEDGRSRDSKILKLFEAPAFTSRTLAEFLRKLLGSSRSYGDDTAGAELRVGSVRMGQGTAAHARPTPTRIRFADTEKPGSTVGVGGAVYPEWDVHQHRYKPHWCRVIDFPLTATADEAGAGVTVDNVLRQQLSRVGLGPKVLRARPDGDELDTEALIDLFVDLRTGFSPPEHVYTERRKIARDLGVLILLDTSGSATDSDSGGHSVHEHQRRAAATVAATLEELGDRVAIYGFRSHGRHAVHLPAVKTFDQRFGPAARTKLAQLEPSGYTRLGAGIRGAGEILKSQAGTPNRLLLVLSDGFPYDHGYEGHYAEADAARALEELRTDGVACLCLAIGANPDSGALQRVFGTTGHAGAATLAELSPRMGELFVSALRELSVPKPQRA